MKVAVLGYGNVGKEVVHILDTTHSMNVEKILVRTLRDDSRCTTDFNEILNDDSIECVVEVMGGIHPAYEYIMASFKAKKHVVSANKAVIAKYLHEFIECASENNVCFKMEASVGGGIPWIKEINRISRFDTISGFTGILNGTTNYILDCMHTYNTSFENALADAQEKGYAESDPTSDIEGFDVQNKVAISCMLAYHTVIDVNDIPTYGISQISDDDIAHFKSKGYCCKLMGTSKLNDSSISAFVFPTITQSIEAQVNSNLNIVSCDSKYLGHLSLIGQGAGGNPTASAVVSDCFDIQSKCFDEINLNQHLSIDNSLDTYHFYIRATHLNEEIALSYEYDENYVYMKTKKMTISEIFDYMKQYNYCFVAVWKETL